MESGHRAVKLVYEDARIGGGHLTRLVVISGCSGGGKSTLVDVLGRRGHHIMTEPGRRVVREELANSGTALPWLDQKTFAARVLRLALEDIDRAKTLQGWVFFDRGLVDVGSFLEELTGDPAANIPGIADYSKRVFFAPPWHELFQGDSERRHDFAAAVAEHDRLRVAYPALGYELETLPFESADRRADYVLATLGGLSGGRNGKLTP